LKVNKTFAGQRLLANVKST